MLKRVARAEASVAQCKRQLDDAEAELTEARKRVEQVGGNEAAQLLDLERKLEGRIAAALAGPTRIWEYAWKWNEGESVCSNIDCGHFSAEDGGHWMLRWVDYLSVACDACLAKRNVPLDWDDLREAMPSLRDAWTEQATLPKYRDESKQELIARLVSPDEWIEGRDDCDQEGLHCAMTYAGYTSGMSHGCSGVHALKGVPGMLLCDKHFDKRHDAKLMAYLLAFIAWGNAVGVEVDGKQWVPVPEEGWAVANNNGTCAQCNRPAERSDNVWDWWGATSIVGHKFAWLCGDCYVAYRKPSCNMCNDPHVPKSSEGELEMKQNLLVYTCKKCNEEP